MANPKYKICPECGQHNPPSLLECSQCEADLTGVRVTDPDAEQEEKPAAFPSADSVSELVRICGECGAKNAPQARKCVKCGEDISDILPTADVCRQAAAIPYELRAVDGSYSAVISEPVCVIGREAALSDYLADKMYVSRQHARLAAAAGAVFLENLNAKNKTFLNNEPIADGQPAVLHDGDEIGLGGKMIGNARQAQAAYLLFRVMK